MKSYDIHLAFVAAIPVGHRIAIEIYDDDSEHPVIVDLDTAIRWGTVHTWGHPIGSSRPRLSRRSEVIVRGCWVATGLGMSLRETHTKLLVEEPPPAEGPYR